jgi:hypothetical protein
LPNYAAIEFGRTPTEKSLFRHDVRPALLKLLQDSCLFLQLRNSAELGMLEGE